MHIYIFTCANNVIASGYDDHVTLVIAARSFAEAQSLLKEHLNKIGKSDLFEKMQWNPDRVFALRPAEVLYCNLG